jgi:Uma2 family endonuclease
MSRRIVAVGDSLRSANRSGETALNVALRHKTMSLEEFLAWECRQDGRWEFDGHEPQAMVGGTSAHNQIAGAVEFALRQQLKSPCRVYREAMRLRLAHTLRYPDLMVVCAPVANDATEITDPIVVIKILSSTTFRTDRIAQNREYEAAPSIRRDIVLEQDAIAEEVRTRDSDRRSTVTGEGVLAMLEIDGQVTLADAYVDLELGTQSS